MSLKEEFLKQINDGTLYGAMSVLARKLGVSAVSTSRWMNGMQFPTEEYISAMAKLAKWPKDKVREMFALDMDCVSPTQFSETMLIPVLGTSSASAEKFILEEMETYLPIKKSASSKLFAIQVEGDCMVDPDDPQNSIYNGNYIIVDPEAPATAGDVVLARIDGEYSTIKRFFPKEQEIELIPDNPSYKPLVYPRHQVEIIGKVTNIYAPVRKKKCRE